MSATVLLFPHRTAPGDLIDLDDAIEAKRRALLAHDAAPCLRTRVTLLDAQHHLLTLLHSQQPGEADVAMADFRRRLALEFVSVTS